MLTGGDEDGPTPGAMNLAPTPPPIITRRESHLELSLAYSP